MGYNAVLKVLHKRKKVSCLRRPSKRDTFNLPLPNLVTILTELFCLIHIYIYIYAVLSLSFEKGLEHKSFHEFPSFRCSVADALGLPRCYAAYVF